MNNDKKQSDFESAAEEQQPGIVKEFIDFLRFIAKWWLTPIILVLLLFAVLIAVTGTGAAPFIYTLF